MMDPRNPRRGLPWWVKHERSLVILGSILVGMPLWIFFAWRGQLELALALHLPLYLIHYHWRGKLRWYLVTCLFAWRGLAVYSVLRHYGVAEAISVVHGLLIGSIGAGFKSARYLVEGPPDPVG